MNRVRLPIYTLMFLVVLVGVSFAILRSPTQNVVSATFLVTFTAIMTALVVGVVRDGPARGTLLGFAIFGGGYMFFAFQNNQDSKLQLISSVLDRVNPTPGPSGEYLERVELTTRNSAGNSISMTVPSRRLTPTALSAISFSTYAYQKAGHLLVSFWFGTFGAFVGFIATPRQRGPAARSRSSVDDEADDERRMEPEMSSTSAEYQMRYNK